MHLKCNALDHSAIDAVIAYDCQNFIIILKTPPFTSHSFAIRHHDADADAEKTSPIPILLLCHPGNVEGTLYFIKSYGILRTIMLEAIYSPQKLHEQ